VGLSDNFLAALSRSTLKARGSGAAFGGETRRGPLRKIHRPGSVYARRELAGTFAIERVSQGRGLREQRFFEGQRYVGAGGRCAPRAK
jgi:hypothetical protein